MPHPQCVTNRKRLVIKSIQVFVLGLITVTIAQSAFAWNTAAMKVNALRIDKSGKVTFTLLEKGTSEYQCKGNSPWLVISPCSANDLTCSRAVDRMTSTLVASKLAGRVVHVQQASCNVTEVALKP